MQFIKFKKPFEKTPQKGLEEFEFVSKSPVRPFSKEIYDSTINTLLSANIEIYFVNEIIFENIVKNNCEDEVVASLKPFTI